MKLKLFWISTLCLIGLCCNMNCLAANSSDTLDHLFLLSDNILPGQDSELHPKGTRVFPTGAISNWINEVTDKGTLKTGKIENSRIGVLFDGSLKTQTWSKWHDGKFTATVVVDFRKPYAIKKIDLWVSQKEHVDTASVKVYVGVDKNNLFLVNTIEKKSSELLPANWFSLICDFPKPLKARFVKLEIHRNNTVAQQQIGDIAIWGYPLRKVQDMCIEASEHLPVSFDIKAIQAGVACVDISEFQKKTDRVTSWRVYCSSDKFTDVNNDKPQLLRVIDASKSSEVIYPLQPDTKYYIGVTAEYQDGEEYPIVDCVEYVTPKTFECKTFGDMLAINHFWYGGGSRVRHKHENCWEQAALDILGQLRIKHVRWWRTNPDIVNKLYEQGIGLVTWPGHVKQGNLLGIFSYSAGNEPDLSGQPLIVYLDQLKTYYKLLKAANPKNTLSAPTSGMEDSSIEWLAEFYKAGGKSYFDVLDLHTYCKTAGGHKVPNGYPKGSPEALFDNMEKVRKVLAKYNDLDKPVIATEFGYADAGANNPSGEITPEIKAQYLVRGLVIHYVLGFKRVFLYSFWDEGQDPFYTEHHFGLLDYELQKKPSFYAVKTVGEQLGDCTLIGEFPGVSLPGIGYLFKDTKTQEYVAIIWDGTRNVLGTFVTDAAEVLLVDLMGNSRKIITSGNKFSVSYGRAPVYIRSDKPLSLKVCAPISSAEALNRRFGVSLSTQFVMIPAAEKKGKIGIKFTNDTRDTVNGTVILRNSNGKKIKKQAFKSTPNTHEVIKVEFTATDFALDSMTVQTVYECGKISYTDEKKFFVRRLADTQGKSITKKSLMFGKTEPVYILANDEIEVSVDTLGGRILEIVDKKSGTNQVHMDYKYIANLKSLPFAYGIWDQINGQLKNSPYEILTAADGTLAMKCKTSDNLEVTKTFHVAKATLEESLLIINQSDQVQELDYCMHPEYTAGGTGDSVTDVLVMPLENEIMKLPFWAGLGEKKCAPCMEGWWAAVDTQSKIAIRQDYDISKFAQPRLWFGQDFYNFELHLKLGEKLEPQKDFKTTVTWKILHNVDINTDFEKKNN